MSKAACPDLQKQLEEKTFEKLLDEGDIVHTGPGNLNCRHVIHCVCCPWKGNPKQEQVRLKIWWATFMSLCVALLLFIIVLDLKRVGAMSSDSCFQGNLYTIAKSCNECY